MKMKPTYPNTKEEVLKSIHPNSTPFIYSKDSRGYFVPTEKEFGVAARKAVEIFCRELADLNSEFNGYFVVTNWRLWPVISTPEEISIKQNLDKERTMYLPALLAGVYAWCAALNKASKYWNSKNDNEKSQLCIELMKDLVFEFRAHLPVESLVHLDEWDDILRKLNLTKS